ncbi:MAG: DUF58 domain-containing protein [Gemmatimonadetes bacterium]|nr:DUF58 domain-containing protein [Gemmatimonadota bacterium]
MTPVETQGIPGARFLDPKTLSRIDNLELLARTVVEGFLNGLHHSPYLGLSVDFAEHRAYMPGDDIRRIDWRLWARTDRFYVKEFEADTNANFSVILDVSRSMDFGTGGISKLDYARYLTACLTWFSRKQRDRVGLVTFDSDIVERIPPSAKNLNVVLHTLDRLKPGRPGMLRAPLLKIAETFHRRSILAVISDFYEEPKAVIDAVNLLRAKGNDLIVFQVLDPAELDFPFPDAANFQDLETGERIPIVPENFRARYQELMSAHVAELEKRFQENGIDYVLFNTATPLDYALFHFLSRRERLARVK